MGLAFPLSSFPVAATTPSPRRNSLCLHRRIPKCIRSSDRLLKSFEKLSYSTGFYSFTGAIKPVSTRHCRSFRIRVGTESEAGAAGSDSSDPSLNKMSAFMDALWRFLRPHTTYGTIIASIALFGRALVENPDLISWSLSLKAFSGLVALLCANSYMVGINQIYDVDIDKVNKPYLPIAAGDLSVQTAWALVLLFAATGLSIVGSSCGSFIISLYCFGFFIGTIYSVPPIRLKRFPVAAFLIIATIRGFLVNVGVYYAARAVLGLPFVRSAPLVFITSFVTLFGLAIAITKDLPDVEGDRKYEIPTLATWLGVRNMAFLGSGLLLVNYIGSIVAAIYMPQAFRRSLMIPAHAFLAASLIYQARVLEKANYTKEATVDFYWFIWKLFYMEYIIFPFI